MSATRSKASLGPRGKHRLVGAAHILIIDLSNAAKLQSFIDRHIKPEMQPMEPRHPVKVRRGLRPLRDAQIMIA